MAATLDRSRPFGSIANDPEGRFFEQDGAYFGADGSAWVEQGAAPARKAKAAPATQLEAQLEAGE